MDIARFIDKYWGKPGGAERATYQMFLTELAQLLGAPTPDPGTGEQVATYAVNSDDLARYLDVLNAPSVIEPLRARLGLAPGTPISVAGEVSQTSNIMTITATGGDPVLLARIANEAGPVLADVATKKFSPLLAANGQSVEATTIQPATAPESSIRSSSRPRV